MGMASVRTAAHTALLGPLSMERKQVRSYPYGEKRMDGWMDLFDLIVIVAVKSMTGFDLIMMAIIVV